MSEDGSTKDDVKVPDGEVGDKISKMFTDEGKDTSELCRFESLDAHANPPLDVIVLTAMGEEVAIDAKEAPKGA
jgi:translation initiation factor 5A